MANDEATSGVKVEDLTSRTDLVTVPNVEQDDLMTDEFLKRLEGSVERYKKICAVAIKLTNENDWSDQGGAPYLEATGAEKIKNPFGINLVDVAGRRISGRDNNGDFYIWEYKGRAFSSKLGGAILECIGVCSSRDKFFARQGNDLIPVEDVPEVRIMQKAYNNLELNAIKRVIGLRSITWEEVTQAGLSKDKIAKVEFAGGGKGGGKISEAQQKRMFAKLMSGSKSEAEATIRKDALKKFLSEKFQCEKSEELGWKNYEAACVEADRIAAERNKAGAVSA